MEKSSVHFHAEQMQGNNRIIKVLKDAARAHFNLSHATPPNKTSHCCPK